MGCDMLVKLYDIEDGASLPIEKALSEEGILIKRAMSVDLNRVVGFVREQFGDGWANECTAGLLKNGCWIAVKDKQVVGFACFEATMPDYFGPTGVLESLRGKGIGKALLLKSLLSLKERGYAYAIIGWAGPVDFYKKCVGAIPIENSIPNSYHNLVQA